MRFGGTFVVLAAAAGLAGCAGRDTGPGLQDSSSLKAAHAALEEGQAATALGIARGVLSVKPHDAAALVAAGNADLALGNPRLAETDFRDALAADGGNVRARLGLAKLKLATDPAGAEADLRRLLGDAPRDPAVLTDLGVALDMQEQHKAAQEYYERALAGDPALTSARVDLAVSLALSGQGAQAQAMLRDASEGITVPPKIRADYALAQVMMGRSQDAVQTLQADLTPDQAKESVTAMESLRPAAH